MGETTSVSKPLGSAEEKARPVLPWDRIEEITQGDRTFETELLKTFLTDVGTSLKSLRKTFEDLPSLQLTQARAEVHGLTGIFATLGIDSLASLSQTLSGHLRNSKVEAAGRSCDELLDAGDKFLEAIRDYLIAQSVPIGARSDEHGVFSS